MSHPYHLTVCDPPDRQEAIHNLIHAYYYYFFSFFMVIIVGIGLITRGRCFKKKIKDHVVGQITFGSMIHICTSLNLIKGK